MLAAEAAAMSFGAQDARFRMSSRAFGPPAPADGDNARVGEPVCAAIAVRCGGYWAAGQTMFGDTPDSLRQRARAIMQSVLATARPGVAVDEVRAAAPDAAMTGHGLGLCLEEAPRFDAGEHFVDGDVVNLAVSLAIANDQSASWSTIVRVERGATRVLWAAPDLDMPAERN